MPKIPCRRFVTFVVVYLLSMRFVALFPLLFPLYLMRGQLFGVPVTFAEVSLLLVFAVFLLRTEWWKKSWWVRHWSRELLFGLFLFLVAAALGVLVTPAVSHFIDGTEFMARTRALGIFKGWILAPMLFFAMARVSFRERSSLIEWALNAMLVSGVALAGHAIFQEWAGSVSTWDGRASSLFESANYLALYLGPILTYAGLQALRCRSWWHAGAAVILAVGLFFTQSYAAWIAVSVALSLGVFLEQRLSRRWLLLPVLAGTILVLTQLGTDKFTQFIDFAGRSSSSVRLEVYEISLRLIAEHPLLGIGLGQFEQFYSVNAPEILGQAPMEWVMLHPHNIVLAFWLNMGLLGVLVFGWMLWRSAQWLREKPGSVQRIAVFMLLAMLVHGLFDTPYFKNDLAFQFWLLMAILL